MVTLYGRTAPLDTSIDNNSISRLVIVAGWENDHLVDLHGEVGFVHNGDHSMEAQNMGVAHSIQFKPTSP